MQTASVTDHPFCMFIAMYIINILVTSFAQVHTTSYGPSFSPLFLWPACFAAGHKAREKNSVHNLWYGPRTRLIRGMSMEGGLSMGYYCMDFLLEYHLKPALLRHIDLHVVSGIMFI